LASLFQQVNTTPQVAQVRLIRAGDRPLYCLGIGKPHFLVRARSVYKHRPGISLP